MFNKVILIGHLGADPETRYLPSGDAVANESVLFGGVARAGRSSVAF